MSKSGFRSGFVAIVGRTNVGKSTLMNHLIGMKIAITSNKPQTTRRRMQTVFTNDEGQIVFLDTPGIHLPHNKLSEYMDSVAYKSVSDVDVILFVVEPETYIGKGERQMIERIRESGKPVVLAVNKCDMTDTEHIDKAIDAYRQAVDIEDAVAVSALKGMNIDGLISVLMKHLPEGPMLYDEDTVTDEILHVFLGVGEIAAPGTERERPELLLGVLVEFLSFWVGDGPLTEDAHDVAPLTVHYLSRTVGGERLDGDDHPRLEDGLVSVVVTRDG